MGLFRIITNHSFKVTFWYRIGHYCINHKNPISSIFFPIVRVIHSHNQYLTGIQLPLETEIGGGLQFQHFSGIVINPKSVIGSHVTIYQGVTLGSERNRGAGAPQIGNHVVIASGAKIIGPIKVGNNVMIGANAVVTKDVPDNAVVAGIPARIINLEGQKYTSNYD